MVDGVRANAERGSQPKYRLLRDALIGMIKGLPEGAALPTERTLCADFGVSRATVRHALQRLEDEQRIYRVQGRGTFVARAKIEQRLGLTSHTEEMRARGMVPGSKLIDVSRIPADSEVASALRLSEGTEVLQIERLRLADGDPIAIEVLYLNAERFDGISAALGESASFYQLLHSDYGVELASAEETIEAVVADPRDAELLGCARAVPLLLISRLSLDTHGRPSEYVRSRYRGDRFRFRRHLERSLTAPAPAEREPLVRAAVAADPSAPASVLVCGIDADAATTALDRHRGRLRPALEELAAPNVAREQKRLGVAAAYIDGVLVQGDVGIVGDRIAAVGLAGAGSGLAIPAFVDAQVNGYAGVDVASAEPEALVELARALLRDGVTAYLPTLITGDPDDMLAALRRIAALAERHRGASIIGVHLEGPFLSPERAGAHPREHLRTPDRALLQQLLDAGPVRMVTLAPELPGADELVELCVRRGIVVSLGHSEASADEAARSFASGATAVTHLFNAMAPIGGRAPGLAGAALAADGVAIQLIADGVHVFDELIRIAFQAAPGRCSLVSDAVAAAGLGDGDFRLGAVEIEVRGGVARRADGTLAGSAGRLRDGLVRLGGLGIDRLDAIAAVTARPAALLGASRFGSLERGGSADVLVVDDQLALQRVVASGSDVDR